MRSVLELAREYTSKLPSVSVALGRISNANMALNIDADVQHGVEDVRVIATKDHFQNKALFLLTETRR